MRGEALDTLATIGVVTGNDPFPEMIDVARQKAAQACVDIDYRLVAVEALLFVDATFDVVRSSLMICHVPEELKLRSLVEVRQVLKPGGRLLVLDFRRPTSGVEPVWQFHRSTDCDLERLPALLQASGFAVEIGGAGFGHLGYVTRRVAN